MDLTELIHNYIKDNLKLKIERKDADYYSDERYYLTLQLADEVIDKIEIKDILRSV